MPFVKVATFNVNSVRARMPVLQRWLAESRPDVVALQEIKVTDELFPREEWEALGYHVEVYGQPRYNGVALASRLPLEDVSRDLGAPGLPSDARLLCARVGDLVILNSYVPNGTAVGTEKWAYKMAWLEAFRTYCDRWSSSDKLLWLGDVNIAPTSDDVWESESKLGGVGHHPDEFERLARIVDWGWTDCFRQFTQGPGHYTYWDYVIPAGFRRNLGWRIDHIYASEGLLPLVVACETALEPRSWERPSDHTPVVVEVRL